ncbi:MAG: hypothetical protein A3A24_02545 [Candidatus Buchananbacteria bacterium RIFCSPLOWO2_01_FULL_46_12]|uniref:Aspartyl/glutamyl-tRNA(Asn/Gln) amidotransferase subunit C n=1 Tax=Candidatus Buchananbacteria bacterium RIFCSPLOWO2_01_FULL_46_12 TaxID=1797546 RepID=A0A1G1YQR4_9BACT|nr:MAG: hypothetical protein A3A24_02545 [Candidatus Buchananbacteria bacterium RIFCSPLOWO2_01_FULL_46_12]
MKLTKKEVEHIAILARLGLSEKEKELFSEQLSSILDYVSQLQKIDTQGVEPTAQITGLENVLAQDIIEEADAQVRSGLLKVAPELEDNLIKTSSVFE